MTATIKTKEKSSKRNDLTQKIFDPIDPQLEAEFKNCGENTSWLRRNRVKLRETYADKCVAVVDKKVCFAAENIPELLKLVRAKYGDDRSVAIGFVPKEHIDWIV